MAHTQQQDGYDNDDSLVASCEQLESFHEDVQYLWCPSNIPVYDEPPSALNFLRNHVSVSRPCIIRNSIVTPETDNNDALVPLLLTLDDLVERFPDTTTSSDDDDKASSSPLLPQLHVDVTPDGHGDCLRKVHVNVAVNDDDNDNPCESSMMKEERKVFVKPLEREMTIASFRHHLRQGRDKQQQQKGADISDRVFLEVNNSLQTTGDDDDDDDQFLDDCVLYYSRQNDCLREELSPLWNAKVLKKSSSLSSENDNNDYLFPRSFPWAEEAFFGGREEQQTNTNNNTVTGGPDAVNLWMGDERVVSSMHKDHYENLFYVLSGEKVFNLCPPSDVPFLYEKEVISGKFQHDHDSGDDDSNDGTPRPRRRWTVELDREDDHDIVSDENEPNNKKYSKVHWIATDLFGKGKKKCDEEEEKEFPLSKYAHPITVKVQAGELLYLPSLWFHRVTQTCETIGINYWYDMNFESPMWCYFHFLQQLQSQKQQQHNNPE
jgi:hypothetical protein